MKSIFGIDFDDTLVDFNSHWKKYHAEFYGTPETNVWATDEGLRRGHEFIHSHKHEMIPVIEGAIEVIETLRKKHQLVIITARDSSLLRPTEKLLEKHFPKVFKGLYFLHEGNRNALGTKGDVCKRIGATKFIDDSVVHAESARDAGVHSFIFSTEANKQVEVPGVTRVNSWKEVLSYVT